MVSVHVPLAFGCSALVALARLSGVYVYAMDLEASRYDLGDRNGEERRGLPVARP